MIYLASLGTFEEPLEPLVPSEPLWQEKSLYISQSLATSHQSRKNEVILMTTDCSLPDMEVQRLLHAAFEAQKNSYSPYSHYPVGAAVLLEDGSIFTGCNVENASYPAGFCAEQNAIGSAIAAGKLNFQAIAVVGSEDTYTTPCGICRQVLAEFHVPYIICGKTLSDYRIYRLEELFPQGFSM